MRQLFSRNTLACSKPLFKRLLLMVLIGIVVSLVQAWVSVLGADNYPGDQVDGNIWSHPYDSDLNFRGFGPENSNGHAWRFQYLESMYGVKGTVLHGADLDREVRLSWQPALEPFASPDVLPRGSMARSTPTPQDELGLPYPMANEIFAGWPMTAWMGQVRTDTRTTIEYRWSIPYTKRSPDFWGPVAVLPYRPLWPGLLVNVLVLGAPVYGFCWLGRWWIVRTKQSRRRRNGLCADCGYELGMLDSCPECGEPVIKGSADQHA